MYSKTFLTMCPVCKTTGRMLRIHLHSEITCTNCFSKFRAEENYIDIEGTHVSDQVTADDTELCRKGLQEGVSTKSADRVVNNSSDRPANLGANHCTGKPLEWRLVCSKGLQEDISTLGANDKEACKVSLKLASSEAREHHPRGVTTLNKGSTGLSRELRWSNESNPAQGTTPKSKKRKQNQISATRGIALTKPLREKRAVKFYSPYESGFRKQGRKKGARLAVKKYRRINQEWGRYQRDLLLGADAIKGKTTTEEKAGKPSKLDFKGYSEEFKKHVTAEIKRQVLGGLDESSQKMVKEIQVVEVEDLHPCTLDTQGTSAPEKQNFIAQVKLMTTILFPIEYRACESARVRLVEDPKSREGSEDESKGRELEPEPEDMVEPKPKDMDEPESKDTEEPEPKDLTEPTELMECKNTLDQEPCLKDGCEVDEPEAEYFDFKFNKSEETFASQQVWASYEIDLDMMPRDYVQIMEVLNIDPFKVLTAVLEPAWLSESGNPLSCGEFSAANVVRVRDKINDFSHLMRWDNVQNGMIKIYPREKEAWALYRDWKESDREKRIKHGYDVVQVVSIDDKLTISVVPLVNHKGSKTVYKKQERDLFQIHERDVERFSHQVPTYEIVGYAGVEGCVELDPAAIPSIISS